MKVLEKVHYSKYKVAGNTLDQKICSLDLYTPSWLAKAISQANKDLSARGISKLKPFIYFSDDWAVPNRTIQVQIPFYLGNPEILSICSQKMITEGITYAGALKLVRHEFGHCFANAYRLQETREFQQIFGNPETNYEPYRYKWQPYSRRYVKNLPDGYAQCHPDEDFAESFAIFLSNENWRIYFRSKQHIIKKLIQVEKWVQKYGNKTPIIRKNRPQDQAKYIDRTIRQYLDDLRTEMGAGAPDFYDKRLKKWASSKSSGLAAGSFLQQNHSQICNHVANKASCFKYEVSLILKKWQKRSQHLGLYTFHNSTDTKAIIMEQLEKVISHNDFKKSTNDF